MNKSLPFHYIRCSVNWIAAVLVVITTISCLVSNAQTVTTGKSYLNITRPTGGTFLPGDIIEVRATIAVIGGSNAAASRLNSVRYTDSINQQKFIYVPNSLRMLSNEGRVQYSYTDAADADSANIDAASGYLRFNIGNSSGPSDVISQGNGITNAGRLWGGSYMRPSFYGNTCIRIYAYRVTITTDDTEVDLDTTVVLRAGNFRYRMGNATSDLLSNFSAYQLRISPDYGLCNNAFGTNAILGESGGSFGSGIAQNRAGGTSFVPPPYSFLNFSSGTPNDNYYGLVNRTSADNSTSNNVAMPGSNRVFSVWDIIGDHTGATNQLAGNAPTNNGYAVIINASYETNRAFTQTITNLCENTFYEFSAWFRNICRRCGCDSTGKGAGSSGYTPAPGNDSSGVRPNLTFQIDNQDYYITGNMPYTGKWIKKGFIFRTRPGQTSFTVTIRNNAPGGGGNDWAIDDIGVATCLPNMQYSPSLTPNVCRENALTIYDTVRSFFPNYTYYKWQRSITAGLLWFDVTLPVGPVIPTWTGSMWQYVTSYTVPPTLTLPINLGDRYRLMVATSYSNLANLNCRSTDATNNITMNVIECGPILSVNLVSFTGKLINKQAALKWTTTGSNATDTFDLERSDDANLYYRIATIAGKPGAGYNYYDYTDASGITNKTWYRLKIRNQTSSYHFSRIVELSNQPSRFAFATVINPFSNALQFDLNTDKRGQITATLTDVMGTPVRTLKTTIQPGLNPLSFDNTSTLKAGIYILRVEQDGEVIVHKVMKRD